MSDTETERSESEVWSSGGEAASHLPPADFSTLVQMLATQSMVALGMIPHPSSGKAEPQLPLAQHFIDLLGVLEAKCTGNLDAQEAEFLRQSLHHLRITFVEIRRLSSKSGPAAKS